MAKVFVTGASGFVGKRLVSQLLEQGHIVYALMRTEGTKAFSEEKQNLHYLWGDLRNPETVKDLPSDIDAAYYLVHSMAEIMSDLVQTEMDVAEHFVTALKERQVKQLIYLGGIINDEEHLSPHLKSRLIVEGILQKSNIPTTILRASIIIGSGSASFEIIRDLSEKLPFMIAPKWLSTPCQPIAIQDVLYYLSHVLLNKECYNNVFDIGGPDILTFKELLQEYAAIRGLKRLIVSVPVLTPRLSSFWLVFITSVRFSLCYYLVESIKSSSVCRHNEITKILPHTCLPCKKALELACETEVASTWMDSWELASISTVIKVPQEGCLKDIQRFSIYDSKEKTIERIFSIGGTTGYYSANWAWKIRGFIDRMLGGVGLNRGRRHPTEVLVGDSIDFWRVIKADREKGDLILFASMKVPGDAWLEFHIEQNTLVQTATFRPKGLMGRLYWYSMFPFHCFIFRNMARSIAGR